MIIFKKTIDKSNEFSKVNITMEFPDDDVSMTDLIEEFTNFLRVMGYPVQDNVQLDWVEDD